MAMTYTKLVGDKTVDGSIKNWINWDQSPSDTILTEAQAFIYSRLRVREMSSFTTALSIIQGASTLAMPANYIANKTLDILTPWQAHIDMLDEEYFVKFRSVDDAGVLYEGQPCVCMIIGDPAVAYFDVRADQAYTASMSYYARPDDLALTVNEENWLTRRYPQLLRAVCNYLAFLHKKEMTQAKGWESIAMSFVNDANVEKDMEAQARRFEPYWRS